MRRGDFVTIAMQGDFGKPRPALVIQANQFDEHATVSVLAVTSTLVTAPLLRITVQPDAGNGLQKPSQVMVDRTNLDTTNHSQLKENTPCARSFVDLPASYCSR